MAKHESAILDSPAATGAEAETKKKRRRITWRAAGFVLLVLIGLLVIARIAAPDVILWYVNRTIDRSPLYDGKVEDIELSLWRGAYTIKNVRLVKTTGNVPVPFFEARQLDLAIEWNALASGKVVGQVVMDEPKLNFVDAGNPADNQTGAGGPWMRILRDLFPFKINSVRIDNGAAHFRAPAAKPPVDVYVSQIQATINNLTNIDDDVAPLITGVNLTGRAMDQADLELQMKVDPFSYNPTFQLATRLIGLDVTKTNALARAYGGFDFEAGYFDLVIEMDSKEGRLNGYVKPLFRNLRVLDLNQDLREDNVLQVFWESLVGGTTRVFRNPPRDQFGTSIPVTGDLTGPRPDLVVTVGNVLRNAFVRAYLPRLDRTVTDVDIRFDPGQVTDVR